MNILIVGGSGFLGAELVRQAVAAGHTTAATYATRPGSTRAVAWHALDLRDPGTVEAVVAEVSPRVIVNASSGKADWKVTAEGPVRLAIAAAKSGSRLVHVSSDAVFSGAARVPYDESCLPDPITPYGAAKAAAETGVLLVHPDAVVARTSLIIGDGQSEHERAVHELATGTRAGVLFTDDFRCPVHVSDLAAALLELASGSATGIHHLGGSQALSRHVPCQVLVFTSCASSAWRRGAVAVEGMGRPPSGLDEQFLSGRLCLVQRRDGGRFDEIDEPVSAPGAEHVPYAAEHVAGGSQFIADGRCPTHPDSSYPPGILNVLGCGLTLLASMARVRLESSPAPFWTRSA